MDALFNGLAPGGPRLLFKGGTSLSKAFGLITRFSEDIDITVFRDDLGYPAEVANLDALSGKKRRARLDAIRAAYPAAAVLIRWIWHFEESKKSEIFKIFSYSRSVKMKNN